VAKRLFSTRTLGGPVGSSGSAPSGTLSVVDDEDGTGATATVGGLPSTTNAVVVYTLGGTLVGSFSRSGNGTVDLAITTLGRYIAMLTADGITAAGPVIFTVSDGDDSYASEVFDQVLARVQGLGLAGIDVANIKGGKHPVPEISFKSDVTAGVMVAALGEQVARKFNSADDVGYGHLILCWTSVNQVDNEANLTIHQKWREQISTAFKIKPGYAPIAHSLLADITVDAASPSLFNPEAFFAHNIDAQALVVRVVLRQPR
jgi:hypothetical protein